MKRPEQTARVMPTALNAGGRELGEPRGLPPERAARTASSNMLRGVNVSLISVVSPSGCLSGPSVGVYSGVVMAMLFMLTFSRQRNRGVAGRWSGPEVPDGEYQQPGTRDQRPEKPEETTVERRCCCRQVSRSGSEIQSTVSRPSEKQTES